MGCGNSRNIQQAFQPLQTVTGIFTVKIQSAHLQHRTSNVFSMDPYLIIKVSNQQFKTQVIKKGDANPKFDQTFQFVINSCYKSQGRTMQIKVMDQNKISDSVIGFGILDLDPIINQKLPKSEVRCFINYERKLAGFVMVATQFREEKSDTLSFQFESATIRRKTSSISNMNCKVKVIIGQEELSTKFCKDSKDVPPSWVNSVLKFNVPLVSKEGLIEVYDDNTLVGSLKIDLLQIMQHSDEKSHSEQFFYEEATAGTLKFHTIKGISANFKEKKSKIKSTIKNQASKQVPKNQQVQQNNKNKV